MANLLDALFLYASENRVTYTRGEKAQETKNSLIAEEAEENIQKLLNSEGQEQFAAYKKAHSNIQQINLEVFFRIGLSIGLELAHL
ncbi:MAG: hypothetical protein HFF72_13630 [Oscillospiraceae bacterium]|jgi:hypothetical protein|nr:hypothetical protein [Oscillospiraceae bacterium]MCI8943821.1 hypothetical protein [Oscillospiraceae bacterium]